MRRKSWVAALGGLALAVALATIGFASGAAAGSSPRSAQHVYVNHAGTAKHTGHAVLPARFRKLVHRALTRTRSLQGTSFTDTCVGGTRGTGDNAGVQSCTITSPAGACIQVTSVATAAQNCTVTQTSPGQRHIAVVVQIITQRSFGPSGSQNGSQTATVTQQNTTASNLSFVVQIAKQFLGTGADASDSEVTQETPIESNGESYGVLPNFAPLVPTLAGQEALQEGPEPSTTPAFIGNVSQTQQLQQNVTVCQGGNPCTTPAGMTGSNLSSVYQSSRQRERAKNAATITQQQNPQNGSCTNAAPDGNTTNMCAVVDQHTTGGRNTSGLVELYRQFQSAINAGSTTQQQDPAPFEGGFDHDIHQESVGVTPGKEQIFTLQRGRQIQRVANGGTVDQFQDPVGRKGAGSFQLGTPDDTWNGSLTSTQLQFQDGAFAGGGEQSQDLTYNGTSSGTINATVTGTENGSTSSTSCPGDGSSNECGIAVQCESGSIDTAAPSPFADAGACFATPNPPTTTDSSTDFSTTIG